MAPTKRITNETASSPETSEEETDREQSGIEVDKGLLNVEITLPTSFFKNQDVDQVIANAKKDGVSEAIKNEDGSVTYKMSKSVHAKMMKKMEDEILQYIEELKSGKKFKSIKDVTYNKAFTEIHMVVEREAFENSFDGFAALGIGFQGMFYQAFNGVSSEDIKVTINVEDESTGEVFNTIVYPDAWESKSE